MRGGIRCQWLVGVGVECRIGIDIIVLPQGNASSLHAMTYARVPKCRSLDHSNLPLVMEMQMIQSIASIQLHVSDLI